MLPDDFFFYFGVVEEQFLIGGALSRISYLQGTFTPIDRQIRKNRKVLALQQELAYLCQIFAANAETAV